MAFVICFLAVICSLLHQAKESKLGRMIYHPNTQEGYDYLLRTGQIEPVEVTQNNWTVNGLTITCYQCNSHNDSRCLMDNLPPSLKLPCGPKDTMCRKISQVVEFEMNGMPPDSRVIRGCGWDESNYKGRCYQRSGFGGRQEVCSCTEDGCNSASIPVGATALMIVTFALLRF